MTAAAHGLAAVVCTDEARHAHAENLAARLGVPLAGGSPGAGHVVLEVTAERLQLRLGGAAAPGPVYADFAGGRTGFRGRRGAQGDEALARAAGARHGHRPSIIDATAGLGRDALVLAARGCRVTLIERHAAVAALLHDALERGAGASGLAETMARMQVVEADARDWLAGHAADVVLVDPMHPPRRKSAAVKKEMAVLQALLGADADATALLEHARAAARERVVVKRPASAGPLGDVEPSGSVTGRSTRFDIYAGRAT